MKNKGISVISVGNLVMGGTGKTPHTIEIVNEYIKRGEKVAVVSLGYKGGIGYKINVISDGEKIFYEPPSASDEPYMIAKNSPGAAVITGKKREESITMARDKFKCAIAVLDDGFQYKNVERDANILLLDQKNPISTGFPFPFGYLREFPTAANRADIIVITRAQSAVIPEKIKKYIGNKPVFFSRAIMKKIVLEGAERDACEFKNIKTAAFSAVASNDAFKKSLEGHGLDVVYFKGRRDHSLLTDHEISRIIEKGHLKGAEIFITTEKDFVKLSPDNQKIFGYLKMDIEIENRSLFFDAIDRLLGRSTAFSVDI